MAIIPDTAFPGKTAGTSAEYPQGKARDVTLTGDGTGTPWRAALTNDIFGFQQWLLSTAAIVPSGAPDTVLVSQYGLALQSIIDTTFPSITDSSSTFSVTVDNKGYHFNGATNTFAPVASKAVNTTNQFYSAFHAEASNGSGSNYGSWWGSFDDDEMRLISGAYYNSGGNHIAKGTTSSQLESSVGIMSVYADIGLTDGVGFTPTKIISFSEDGTDFIKPVISDILFDAVDTYEIGDNTNRTSTIWAGKPVEFAVDRSDTAGNPTWGSINAVVNWDFRVRQTGSALAWDANAVEVARMISTGDWQNANNSYGAISDQVLKQDIVTANSQWEDVKAYKLRNYKYISEVVSAENKQLNISNAEQDLATKNDVQVTIQSDYEQLKTDVETANNNYFISAVNYKSILEDNKSTNKQKSDAAVEVNSAKDEKSIVDNDFKAKKLSLRDANRQVFLAEKHLHNMNEVPDSVKTHLGVVAQEVEVVSPGLISTAPDEPHKGVNYMLMLIKSMGALQEAMAKIEVLEEKVNTLEGN